MRRPSASVGLSVLLVLMVIAAAGLSGTAHFAGPRFVPHVRSGSHLAPPKSGQVSSPRIVHQKTSSGSSGWAVWVGVALLVAVLALFAWLLRRWWLNRRAARVKSLTGAASLQVFPAVTALPQPEPEVLLTGIAAALRALDEERDPGDAVVRAWLGMEETAAESGILRGPSETPTEFTSQIMRTAFADDRAIQTLLRLYLRTRFGDHPVTAADVSDVREALQHLIDNWRRSDQRAVVRSR
jgi:hypothetical protein